MKRDLRLGPAGSAALTLAGLALLVVAVGVGLAAGVADLSWAAALEALMGEGDSAHQAIVRQIRLPRVAGAVLVGGGLAVVGAVLQAVLRNPLADPYLLGISSGASVGAAVAALVTGASVGFFVRGGLALGAALLSVAIVYGVAQVGGRLPPVRLVLAGVALSAFATALTGFLLYLVPEATAVRGVVFWLLGGLSGVRADALGWTAAFTAPLLLVLLLTARWQTLLLLGDEAALSLGLDVGRARRWLIVVGALATGLLVAFAGAIGFVGLVVPHALRPFTGPDHRRLLPAALVFGALLLVVMDTVARTAMQPEELPVGILTGLLGGPFFLALLRSQGRVA